MIRTIQELFFRQFIIRKHSRAELTDINDQDPPGDIEHRRNPAIPYGNYDSHSTRSYCKELARAMSFEPGSFPEGPGLTSLQNGTSTNAFCTTGRLVEWKTQLFRQAALPSLYRG